MEKINQPGWLDGRPPNEQTAQPPTPGAWFLASLPVACRPDLHAVARLAPKVDALLDGDWTADTLRSRLTAGIDSAHSPVGALVRRLENLPLPKGVQPPARPPWCGECDEHTRQRENDEGQPYRCPRCNPRAVSA